jgi:hypothetical protein
LGTHPLQGASWWAALASQALGRPNKKRAAEWLPGVLSLLFRRSVAEDWKVTEGDDFAPLGALTFSEDGRVFNDNSAGFLDQQVHTL